MDEYNDEEFYPGILVNNLERENQLLRQRLHNSKRDNRTNRDRLRRQNSKLLKWINIILMN